MLEETSGAQNEKRLNTSEFNQAYAALHKQILNLRHVGKIDFQQALTNQWIIAALLPGIKEVAKKMRDLYNNSAPKELLELDFFIEYIVRDLAPRLRDLIETSDNQENGPRGTLPALALLFEYDRNRTNDNEDCKFDKKTWEKIFSILLKILQSASVDTSTSYFDNRIIERLAEYLSYQPIQKNHP